MIVFDNYVLLSWHAFVLRRRAVVLFTSARAELFVSPVEAALASQPSRVLLSMRVAKRLYVTNPALQGIRRAGASGVDSVNIRTGRVDGR